MLKPIRNVRTTSAERVAALPDGCSVVRAPEGDEATLQLNVRLSPSRSNAVTTMRVDSHCRMVFEGSKRTLRIFGGEFLPCPKPRAAVSSASDSPSCETSP